MKEMDSKKETSTSKRQRPIEFHGGQVQEGCLRDHLGSSLMVDLNLKERLSAVIVMVSTQRKIVTGNQVHVSIVESKATGWQIA